MASYIIQDYEANDVIAGECENRPRQPAVLKRDILISSSLVDKLEVNKATPLSETTELIENIISLVAMINGRKIQYISERHCSLRFVRMTQLQSELRHLIYQVWNFENLFTNHQF